MLIESRPKWHQVTPAVTAPPVLPLRPEEALGRLKTAHQSLNGLKYVCLFHDILYVLFTFIYIYICWSMISYNTISYSFRP